MWTTVHKRDKQTHFSYVLKLDSKHEPKERGKQGFTISFKKASYLVRNALNC